MNFRKNDKTIRVIFVANWNDY